MLGNRRGTVHQLTKEGIVESYGLDTPHIQVVQQIGVQVEKDRHVHRLAGVQPLLLEAEALDLAEIRSALSRSDAVCRDTNDVLVALVRRCIEGQGGLAGQDTDLALLRYELPGQHVGNGGVEGDFDAVRRRYGDNARGDIFVLFAACAVGAHRLSSPAGRLADLKKVGIICQPGFSSSGASQPASWEISPSCRTARIRMHRPTFQA